MNPNDQQFWGVFLLLGVPLILMYGDPFGWRALMLLGALAGLAYAPLITIAVVVVYALRWLIADFFLAFVAGLGGGLGLRASGWRTDRIPRRSMLDRWRSR